jgi:hypothetical protein
MDFIGVRLSIFFASIVSIFLNIRERFVPLFRAVTKLEIRSYRSHVSSVVYQSEITRLFGVDATCFAIVSLTIQF